MKMPELPEGVKVPEGMRTYKVARPEKRSLGDALNGVSAKTVEIECVAVSDLPAILAAERERIVNSLLARNLLTIELEEAIRGPLAGLDSTKGED